jgi:hypothetical protein
MAKQDYHWAMEVSRVLRRRGLPAIHELKQAEALVKRILDLGDEGTWQAAVASEDQGDGNLSTAAIHKRIDRARELLTRSVGGLSGERISDAPRFKAAVRASNELVMAELLLRGGAGMSARISAQRAANISRDHSNTNEEIRALTMLRRIDAMNLETGLLRAHDHRLRHLCVKLGQENEAGFIEDYVRIRMQTYSRKPSATKREIEVLVKRLGELDSGHSATITLSRYRVTLWYYSLQGRASEMLHVGTEAAAWLDDNPRYESIGHRVEFEGSRMSACLLMKRIDEAVRVWPVIESKVTVGGGNWVGLLQLYFLVCMSGKKFEEAGSALASYVELYRGGGPAWRKQVWIVFRAYFLLLVEEGLVHPGRVKTSPRVYAGTILKSCSDLARDKPLWGAGIFVLQVLQQLKAHNYSAMIDSTDQLRRYASRYLRSTQTSRTGVFFRALASIPIVDFDSVRAQERYVKLTSRHADAWGIDRDDAEIVPYDVLWSIVVSVLARNRQTRRR